MADDRFPQQQPVPSGEHLYIIPKTGKHYEFPFFLYGIETLIASLNDNYINNFIYDFMFFFNDFTMSKNNGTFSDILFNDFMVEFMFFL